ncbi:MFS transporter [Streptomyces canus]|uniref:MFS transporter n=1 Tax=Streptomyces canus TaxID=58343 RepID=UPI002E2FF68C|nr:MFS transporter [Streptomyces canus]
MNTRSAGLKGPNSAEHPESVEVQGAKGVVLVTTLMLGVIAYQLNASMVTPALPEMAREFGGSVGDISQVSSLFFLAGAIAGVVFTRLSDFTGRKKMLLAVLAITALGTLLCALAPSLPLLLTGRVLQGASSAAFQLAYVILNERLSARVFGTALGVITAINGGVGGLDGYLGGLLTDHLGFRSIFATILLVGVIAAICVALLIPADTTTVTQGRMDWWGSAALSIGLICVTYGVSNGSSHGWTHPGTLGYLAATAALFALFLGIERRTPTPLIAVEHLRSRQVWPVIATTVIVLAGVFAVINFTVVIISQNTGTGYGLSASQSALLYLTPAAVIGVFAAPLSGWLATRSGWIPVLRVGLVLCIAALIVIALAPQSRWIVLAAVASLGIFYNGLVLTTVNGLGVIQSPKEAPAALPGLNGAAFGIGAGLGIGVVAPFAARGTVTGFTTALWISVGITVLALAASLCITPRKDAD